MAEKASVIVHPHAEGVRQKKREVLRHLVVALRPHHSLKNLFVLAPLLFGKRLADVSAIVQALLAFASFCLVSSSLYLINDIADAAEDRIHPLKRLRPIASGALPIGVALTGSGILLFLAFWVSSKVGYQFVAVTAAYTLLILGYCISFKKIMVFDAMTIALGFVLRVVGGAVAVKVVPTHWLIGCAFLLALYLAFAKRRQELLTLSDTATQHRQVLGKYNLAYLNQVNTILIGATVVCYALYTVAPETITRFGTDSLIYGTVFVIYGLLRYLAIIQDPAYGSDPVQVLVRDQPLLIAVFGWAVYNTLIIYFPSILLMWERL
jgi:4-hydroxybenzoate polyprenyltransferase